MSLIMEIGLGDTLIIGGSKIRLERKNGQRARLLIDGPDNVSRIKAGTRGKVPSPTPISAASLLIDPAQVAFRARAEDAKRLGTAAKDVATDPHLAGD